MGNATDLRALLREGDPVAREGGLLPEDAASIRGAALAGLQRRAPIAVSWPGPWFVTATVAATLVAGVALGRMLRSQEALGLGGSAEGTVLARRSLGEGGRRQLQFATPGGTRIIWVFDPEFNP